MALARQMVIQVSKKVRSVALGLRIKSHPWAASIWHPVERWLSEQISARRCASRGTPHTERRWCWGRSGRLLGTPVHRGCAFCCTEVAPGRGCPRRPRCSGDHRPPSARSIHPTERFRRLELLRLAGTLSDRLRVQRRAGWPWRWRPPKAGRDIREARPGCLPGNGPMKNCRQVG